MITNSKPELCEVCGATAEKPNQVGVEYYFPATRLCTAPIHFQADKHKRVAERLLKISGGWLHLPTRAEFERILREEYPE